MVGFVLPFGVALEAGMGLKIGRIGQDLSVRTCNSVGCIATTPFDDALAASLKNADDVPMFAGWTASRSSAGVVQGYSQSLSATARTRRQS